MNRTAIVFLATNLVPSRIGEQPVSPNTGNRGAHVMRVLGAMSVGVEYGQIYVLGTDTGWTDPVAAGGGQRIGLCGTGWPGALMLITGLQTGRVRFTVDDGDAGLTVRNPACRQAEHDGRIKVISAECGP